MPRHPKRHPLPVRTLAFLALVTIAALVAGRVAPARAGIGNLLNSAKKAATGSVTQKPDAAATPSSGHKAPPPRFDATVVELDDARVGKLVEALKLQGAADHQRADLQTQQGKLRDQISAINDRYGKQIDAARARRDKVQDCMRDVLRGLEEQHQKEMQQKMMSDPAAQQKMIDMAQQMAKAQRSGDTATMDRLQDQMKGMTGNTHADTLAAEQKCGPLPAPDPQQAKLDDLEHQSAKLDDQMRGVDDQLHADQQKLSGLDPAQFAMARERLQMYLDGSAGGRDPGGVTPDEAKAIQAHRAELEAALKGS